MRLFFIPAILTLARPAIAWGAAGHEIVATIAQVHLHPDVKEAIRGILPPEAGGRLASVAAWADGVRGRYRETGPMHYVNRESAGVGRPRAQRDPSPSKARSNSRAQRETLPSEARREILPERSEKKVRAKRGETLPSTARSHSRAKRESNSSAARRKIIPQRSDNQFEQSEKKQSSPGAAREQSEQGRPMVEPRARQRIHEVLTLP